MTILGLNAYHADASACLMVDGKLVAAAQEERFRRVKHWAGLPTEAIRYCLHEAGLGLDSIERIAVNRDPRVNNLRRVAYTLMRRPRLGLLTNRLRNIGKAALIEHSLRRAFPHLKLRARVHHIEHHLAHLASSYLASPFAESVALSVDGFGDFASAAWGMGQGNDLRIDGRIYFPHSLGILYSALTQFVGFPHYGDEYKVMGLAPYGQPHFLLQLRQLVQLQSDGGFRLNLRYFRHHKENAVFNWENGSPTIATLFSPALEELLGPARRRGEALTQRHKDLARSAQAVYEEAFFHLLDALHQKYRCPALALSGGCALNSVANGKICHRTKFTRIYLPPAAGDAGGAIGAALVVSQQVSSAGGSERGVGTDRRVVLALPSRRFGMTHAYWGPQSDPDHLHRLLKAQGESLRQQCCNVEKLDDPDLLCQRTAAAISQGKVIGWFQGRMEWGPRALGNRSILGDPRRLDMKDILNQKIKRRESFRPFAPSILREAVRDWFETDDDVPFMMQVFQVRPERRALIPAVTHVDGSGRLHTVTKDANPLYYRLISQFFHLTQVPMVLNTSFNENEPVVCRPEEALDCFLRTKMDLLVLGPFLIERSIRLSSVGNPREDA